MGVPLAEGESGMKNVRTGLAAVAVAVAMSAAASPATARASKTDDGQLRRWESTTPDGSRCEGDYVSCTASATASKRTGVMTANAALVPSSPGDPAASATAVRGLVASVRSQVATSVKVTARIRIRHAEAVREGNGVTDAAVYVGLSASYDACPDGDGSITSCNTSTWMRILEEADVPGSRDGEVVEVSTVLGSSVGTSRLIIEPLVSSLVSGPTIWTVPDCAFGVAPAGEGLCSANVVLAADVPGRAIGDVVVEGVTIDWS